jgi:hypothetical protein
MMKEGFRKGANPAAKDQRGGGGGRLAKFLFIYLEGLPEKSSDALFKEMLPHVGINS